MNELPQIRTLLAEMIDHPHDPHTVLRVAFLIRCKVDDLEERQAKRTFTHRLFTYLDNQIKQLAK